MTFRPYSGSVVCELSISYDWNVFDKIFISSSRVGGQIKYSTYNVTNLGEKGFSCPFLKCFLL